VNQPERGFVQVPIERVQQFWDVRPCNIRHSNKDLGSREYFDEVEQRKYFVEPHIPLFAQFERWKGKRVLEIGCGIGTDTISFSRQGAQVTAVELSERSLEIARQRAQVYGLANRIDFIRGNAEELSSLIPAQQFDLVYSFGVIHHSPNPRRIIEELKPFIAPQGELRLMVYARVSYKLFWIMREEEVWDMARIDELISRNSEAQSGCPVTYSYTEESLRRLLEGFVLLDLQKRHIFTWHIPDYIQHRYVKDPAWAGVTEAELAELEKEMGWHLLATARPLG
jgi:ubiquinone/menaquinone biosynthesis C-methylase UbiE